MSSTSEQRIRPGDTVENPVTGERFTFTETAASSDGELLAFDFSLKPGGAVPMPHVHPVQTERFEIVSGQMRFRVGLRTVMAGPGDVVLVEPGVAHSFANAGEEEAVLRVEVRPALAMEDMFADVVALAEAGRMTSRGMPPRGRAIRRRRSRPGRPRDDLMSGHIDLTQPVLVLGATGKTGRRIAERLESRGVAVRRGSRDAQPPFDWHDQATWPAALDSVSAVYISYFPDLAVPGAAEAVSELARLAVELGVERIVLLSGRGEEEAQAAERAVQAIAPGVTVVRCSWFCQNFSESYLLEPVLAGEVVLPVGAVPEPFVDADDIADVAAAALTDGRHAGELYELTGPRALTFADAVAEIATVTGREIAFETVSVDDYVQALHQEGLPDDLVGLITYLFAEVLDGRNVQVCDGVQRALGRPPRDFRRFVIDAAAAGAWEA